MPDAIVVGGGSGLGEALASLYREHGWTVRVIDRADCDLADVAGVRALANELLASGRSYDLCILSAGASEAGYVDELDPDVFRRCLEINFLAPVTLFRAVATAASPCRRFVFVLSGAADLLLPGLGPYALSKRALRDYLHLIELEGSFPDCLLVTVRPGAMATRFDEKTRVHGRYRLVKGSRARSVREVAERVYAAERAGRARLSLSPLPSVLGWLQNVAPAPMRWLVRHHPAFRHPT